MRYRLALLFVLSCAFQTFAIHPSDTLILRTTEAGQFSLLQPGEFKLAEDLVIPAYDLDTPLIQYRHFKFHLPYVLAPVFRYQENLVTYKPCDGISDHYLITLDSCIMMMNFDGMNPYPIAAIEEQSSDKITFRILHYHHDEPDASNEHYWTFESLDHEYGLWLLTMTNAQTQEQWSTCWIDYHEIHNLARLECYCPIQKQAEWNEWREFDTTFLKEYKRQN